MADFREVAGEARAFLSLRPHTPEPDRLTRAPAGSAEAARRLFGLSRPIIGTLAEAYLRGRGLTTMRDMGALRFHPRCFYRPDEHAPAETGPALITAVTDVHGQIGGMHRTWLDPEGIREARLGKAPIDTPRRAIGELLGHAVRFGNAADVLAAGEGIETMLSLRTIAPNLPIAAALSAANLRALVLPHALRRLYIARDNDPAGEKAASALSDRARAVGIEVLTLTPRLGDFNEDLRLMGPTELRAELRVQLVPEDVPRFMRAED